VTGIDPAAIARLLKPRSVAIVGASEEPDTIGGRVFHNLLRAKFAGELHLVSRTRAELLGRPCVKKIDDLPVGVDALVLMVPAEAVRDSIAACVRRKVNGAIIFSSGFAEMGDAGKAEQAALAAAAREGALLLVGPNCLGFTNYVDGVPLTFDEYKPMAAAKRPGVALIAQSGGLVNSIRDSLVGSGVTVTYNVSSGNESVVTAEDFLEYAIDDAATGTIILFAEQIRQPQRLVRLAARARAKRKPIVLMQPGRTEKARAAAQSHTGALTGDLAVMRAVLGAEGAAVVDSFDTLVDAALILNRYPVPALSGVAMLTNSGAMRGVAFDIAEQTGIDLVEFSESTLGALRAIVPPYMPPENPFDIATLTFKQPDLWGRCTEILLEEPRAGALLVSIFPGTLSQQASRVQYMLPPLKSAKRPVAFVALGEPKPLDESFVAAMRAEEIPLFRSTERAMRAMAEVVRLGRAQQRRRRAPSERPLPIAPTTGGTLTEYRSKELLAAAGIPVPKGELAHDVPEAQKIAARIGYPVVLKAQAAALAHKSDAGGVAVNIADATRLYAAWEEMQAKLKQARPDLKLDGVLVERMARPGVEMIVGARRDPDWGVVLVLGLGGVWVEALRDMQVLPARADEVEIVAALKRLRGAALFEGTRGSPPIDLAPIARIAATLADLVERTSAAAEIEINPLVAYPAGEGALALDALIVTVPAAA
jgi:acyl-CoA synthetase (NDP forming)